MYLLIIKKPQPWFWSNFILEVSAQMSHNVKYHINIRIIAVLLYITQTENQKAVTANELELCTYFWTCLLYLFQYGNFILAQLRMCLHIKENLCRKYLGSGHLPLRRSSSTYWCNTSWNRCSKAVTANRPASPPSKPRTSPESRPSSKENCSNVSKHVLANSSRSFCSFSPSVNKKH